MKHARTTSISLLAALLLIAAFGCAGASAATTIKPNNEDRAQRARHGGGFLVLTRSKGHIIGRIKASRARKLRHPRLSASCYQLYSDHGGSEFVQIGHRRPDGSVELPGFAYTDLDYGPWYFGTWCLWNLTSIGGVAPHTGRVNDGYELSTAKGSTRRVDEINTLVTMENAYDGVSMNEETRQYEALGEESPYGGHGPPFKSSKVTSRPIVALSGPDARPPAGAYGSWVNLKVHLEHISDLGPEETVWTTTGSYTKVGPDPSGTGFLWIDYDDSTKVTSTNVAGALQDLHTVQYATVGRPSGE